MIIHSPIISGSLTFADGATFSLPSNGTFSGVVNATNGVVSGSSQVVGSAITTNTVTVGSTAIALGGSATTIAGLTSVTSTTFVGALQGNASTATTANTAGAATTATSATTAGTATTAGALTTPRTINGTSFDGSANITIPNLVSGSSQITYASVSSIPGGIVSGSSQTIINLNSAAPGVVSGSSQVTYANISSIPAGIVSGSTQVTPLLPTGVISGSSQLSGTTITNLTITNLTVVNETASVIFTSGSNRFGDFSDDTHQFTGSVQISGSIATIGTSTATSFNGAINATNGVVSGSSQVTLSSTTGGGTSAAVQFGSLGIGMVASVTAGRIDATNDIVAYSSSDIRFKENIIAIETPLDKISKIGGYTYDWKQENHIEHGYEGNDVGVIAQEIEAVLPQLVQTRENGYKAVKYDKLVALLIEGIKEQQKQIDDLISKVHSLENNI